MLIRLLSRNDRTRKRLFFIIAIPLLVLLIASCTSQAPFEPVSDPEPPRETPCDALEDLILKDMCYSALASYENHTELCERIEDTSMRIDCYNYIVAHRDLCEWYETEWEQDLCYLALASSSYDIAPCASIASSTINASCIHAVAVRTASPELCKSITDFDRVSECEYWAQVSRGGEVYFIDEPCEISTPGCITAQARSLSSSELCMTLGGVYTDRCLQIIASDLNDATLCEYIVDVRWKGNCFRLIAANLIDESLCAVIEPDDLRETCVRETKISRILSELP